MIRTWNGTVKSVSANAITFVEDNSTHVFDANCVFILNENIKIQASDLLPGDNVEITGEPATKVVASR